MIQAALSTKKLDNSDSLPEMNSFLIKYSRCRGNLDFLNAIHIAGSKGKGSVCAFTERILRSKGLKTGMFTSPHLVHPRERIRINGSPVSEESFAKHVLKLDSDMCAAGEQMSFFRFLWIIAVEIFYEAGVDVGIIEVGMGGRFDSTNVLRKPVVCGLTSLALEHVAILGPTIQEITWHKAGIIKDNAPVFSVQQSLHPEIQEIILNEAASHNSLLTFVNPDDWVPNIWHLGISGKHQLENASLACAMASQWISTCRPNLKLSANDMKSSLEAVRWPGRQQIVSVSSNLTLFLDGSHTLESILATASWFKKSKTSPTSKSILYFHCSPDRDFKSLLRPLLEMHEAFHKVYFMLPESVHGDTCRILETHREMSDYWNNRTGTAISEIIGSDFTQLEYTEPTDVLVCGSLYLVGHFMKAFHIET